MHDPRQYNQAFQGVDRNHGQSQHYSHNKYPGQHSNTNNNALPTVIPNFTQQNMPLQQINFNSNQEHPRNVIGATDKVRSALGSPPKSVLNEKLNRPQSNAQPPHQQISNHPQGHENDPSYALMHSKHPTPSQIPNGKQSFYAPSSSQQQSHHKNPIQAPNQAPVATNQNQYSQYQSQPPPQTQTGHIPNQQQIQQQQQQQQQQQFLQRQIANQPASKTSMINLPTSNTANPNDPNASLTLKPTQSSSNMLQAPPNQISKPQNPSMITAPDTVDDRLMFQSNIQPSSNKVTTEGPENHQPPRNSINHILPSKQLQVNPNYHQQKKQQVSMHLENTIAPHNTTQFNPSTPVLLKYVNPNLVDPSKKANFLSQTQHNISGYQTNHHATGYIQKPGATNSKPDNILVTDNLEANNTGKQQMPQTIQHSHSQYLSQQKPKTMGINHTPIKGNQLEARETMPNVSMVSQKHPQSAQPVIQSDQTVQLHQMTQVEQFTTNQNKNFSQTGAVKTFQSPVSQTNPLVRGYQSPQTITRQQTTQVSGSQIIVPTRSHTVSQVSNAVPSQIDMLDVQKLLEINSQLTKKITMLEDENSKMIPSTYLSQLQKKTKLLINENDRLCGENERLLKVINNNASAIEEKEKTEARINNLTEEIKTWKAQCEEWEAKYRTALVSINEKDNEPNRDNIRTLISDLELQVQSLIQENQSLNAILADQMKEIENYEGILFSFNQCQSQNERLNNHLKTHNNEMEGWKRKYQDLEKKLCILINSNQNSEENKKKIEELENHIRIVIEENQQLTHSLQQNANTINGINLLQEKVNQLLQQNQRLENQIIELSQKQNEF